MQPPVTVSLIRTDTVDNADWPSPAGMVPALNQEQQRAEATLVRAVNWATLIFIAVLSVLCGIWGYYHRAAAYEAAEAALERQRAAIAGHVTAVFRLSETFLAGADRWIAANPAMDPRFDPKFAQLVLDFQGVAHEAMLVRTVDADGTLNLVPPGDPLKKANVADRDYFRAAMSAPPGTIVISAPFVGRATGKWAIAVAKRLTKPTEGLAVVFVAAELSLFDALFESHHRPEGCVISLIRRDGTLLARSGVAPDRLGRNVSRSAVFVSGLSRSEQGVVRGAVTEEGGGDGIISYGVLPGYPLLLTVAQSTAAVEAATWRTLYLVTGALLALTTLLLLARWRVVLLLRRLSQHRQLLGVLASQDHLTGIMNRRRFLEACDEAFHRVQRYGENCSFIVLDIDHFKDINDRYGHPAGDAVLKHLVATCKECLRGSDYLGRLGGEEFGVLLPNTGLEGAAQLAERMRRRIEDGATEWNNASMKITASFGLTEISAADPNFEAVFGRADHSLYEAKSLGRNRICRAEWRGNA